MKSPIRSISAIIMVIMVGLSIPAMTAGSVDEKTQGASLNDMMRKFPHGKYWNHQGMYENNPDSWTDIPCDHIRIDTENGYYFVGEGWCNYFGGDCQCSGFANRLLHDIYGVDTFLGWPEGTLETLKPGDVVRYKNDMHTVLVTAVYEDFVCLSDCNIEFNNCQISWNYMTTKPVIAETLTKVYSAPSEMKADFSDDIVKMTMVTNHRMQPSPLGIMMYIRCYARQKKIKISRAEEQEIDITAYFLSSFLYDTEIL